MGGAVCGRPSGRSGIVYCATRKTTEALTDTLNQMGHPAVAYHGGMSPDAREAASATSSPTKVPGGRGHQRFRHGHR